MSATPIAQPHHLRRKAVIYIRQSTGHQVLTNTESQQLQHAMREHACHLGWPDERIEVVATDLGRTAQSTDRRDGYKALLAEVALGQVASCSAMKAPASRATAPIGIPCSISVRITLQRHLNKHAL
jgi:hypothetical protein